MTTTMSQSNSFTKLTIAAVALFFTYALWLTVGAPDVAAAIAFFGIFPSPHSAESLVDLVLWLAFAGLAGYGVLSVVGMTHRTWAARRREHLAEIALGGLGFGLLCLSLVHGGGASVHPGAIHEALTLVRSAK